jgi:mono/diheme cytochrome c family protein
LALFATAHIDVAQIHWRIFNRGLPKPASWPADERSKGAHARAKADKGRAMTNTVFLKPLASIALAVLVAIGLPARSWAENGSDVRAGQELAVHICSPCHTVSPPVGPPFAEIANGSRAGPEALRDFLYSTQSHVGHPGAMPRLDLTDTQIDQISAYLQSLRQAK